MVIETLQTHLVELLLLGAAGYLFFADNKAKTAAVDSTVEESISGLIYQAKEASEGLNDALLERKSELESLLQRLEDKERNVLKAASQISRPERQSSPAEEPDPENEFPNESWLKPAAKLEALVEKQQDSVKLTLGQTDEKIAHSLGVDLPVVKVARRLLVAGQEDLKVAKKLGLSVNDIKQLKAMFGIKSVKPQLPKAEAIRKYNFGLEEAVNG